MKWELKTLDELGFVGRGKSRHRPRNAEHLYGGIYPLIQTGDIQKANFYINEYYQTYSEDGLAQSKLWKEGTMVISIVGANTAETAILGFDACFPDSVIGFIPDIKKADVKFVKYNLESFKLHLKSISEGTARENLSLEKLLSIKLPTPPLLTQRKITSILSAYDDLIEKNLKRIKLLEEAANISYKKFKIETKNNWIADNFSKFFSINNGFAFKAEWYEGEGVPLIRTRDYSFSRFINIEQPIFIDDFKAENFSKYLLKEFDFLLIMVGASIGRYGIVLPKDLPALQNQNQWSIREKAEYDYLKVIKLLLIEEILETLLQQRTGAARDFFRASFLNELEISIPPEFIGKELNLTLSYFFNQINILQKQNTKLRVARDILLPKLMSGQIEV
jgi:type I restriction enzyme S subunit